MFMTTTLSAKSESFNESPSIVWTDVSRSSWVKGTLVGGGATVLAAGLATRLAGAVLLVLTLLFELQREIP